MISPVRLPDIVSGCRGPLLCKQGEVFEVRRSVGHKPVIKYTANEVRLGSAFHSSAADRDRWWKVELCALLFSSEDRDGWGPSALKEIQRDEKRTMRGQYEKKIIQKKNTIREKGRPIGRGG